MALQMQEDIPTVLFGRLTLGVFAVVGIVVALATWDILPREGILVGAPALAAAMLLDTFLYNELLIRTGSWIWLEIYAFIYVEAVVVGAVAHLIHPYWTKHVASET